MASRDSHDEASATVPRWVFMLLWAAVVALASGAYLDQRASIADLRDRFEVLQRDLYEVRGDVKWLRYDRNRRNADEE